MTQQERHFVELILSGCTHISPQYQHASINAVREAQLLSIILGLQTNLTHHLLALRNSFHRSFSLLSGFMTNDTHPRQLAILNISDFIVSKIF